MYEMHGHLGQDGALLNVAAGVTSVRDMGNNNEVLTELIGKIQSGRLVGPRVIRSGFIEGRSPFNSNSGIVVSSEADAVQAVREYSNGDFHQVKIYNSMNPDWVPAVSALTGVRPPLPSDNYCAQHPQLSATAMQRELPAQTPILRLDGRMSGPAQNGAVLAPALQA